MIRLAFVAEELEAVLAESPFVAVRRHDTRWDTSSAPGSVSPSSLRDCRSVSPSSLPVDPCRPAPCEAVDPVTVPSIRDSVALLSFDSQYLQMMMRTTTKRQKIRPTRQTPDPSRN